MNRSNGDPICQRTDRLHGSSFAARLVGRREMNGPAAATRFALYSHDAMGVGHVRRNLLIAQHLSLPPVRATSLIICGIHEASSFAGGHGIDCLTLPSFTKHSNDDYRPRDLRLATEVVSEIRTQSLRSGLLAMKPHFLLVDKVPRGLYGELEAVLPILRRECGTKVIFGMRDVLDSPQRVRAEWERHDYASFLREHYDAIWVYGDPMLYDPIERYDLQSLRDMVHYTGYFDQRERLQYVNPLDHSADSKFDDLENTVLCMVGGGQDGGELGLAFAQAEFPAGLRGLLVLGPLMPRDDRLAIMAVASGRTDLKVVVQVPDADLLMPHVRKVICMGGYNSLMSVISFAKDSLIVPRVNPRQEQCIRAECFAKLGMLDVLHPSSLSAAALTWWMANEESPRPTAPPVKLDGLDQIVRLVTSSMDANHPGWSLATHPQENLE